jgi:hypothetical protein
MMSLDSIFVYVLLKLVPDNSNDSPHNPAGQSGSASTLFASSFASPPFAWNPHDDAPPNQN